MLAYQAIAHLGTLNTEEEIKVFTVGDKRKTVLDRAQKRIFHIS